MKKKSEFSDHYIPISELNKVPKLKNNHLKVNILRVKCSLNKYSKKKKLCSLNIIFQILKTKM